MLVERSDSTTEATISSNDATSASAVQSASQSSPLQVQATGTSPTSAMMLSPPPVLPTSSPPTTAPEYHQPDAPDTKEGIEELCPVCGDKVSGYHYGLLTCESCKGFFKRTVQNKKVYTCVADRSCHIDKSQRKRCPFCRFQKCLDVGMKLEAVRADRMRGGRNKFGPMYKRDRARRLQMMRQKQMNRTPCQGPGEVMPGTPTPPFHNTSPPLYAGGGAQESGIKQELIQIPQLSSSTSSPDSSPSPLTSGVKSLGNHFGHHHHPAGAPLQVPMAAMTDPSKVCWVSPGSPTPPASELSPKAFPPVPPHDGSPSSAGPLPLLGKVPPLIQEFQASMMDDKEWQSQLFALLQNQTYNQCEVDLFELLCKVIDQSLFAQVDWARNSIYFKDLKVDDQMKLLQNSWSAMLVLDHIHQRLHHGLPDETTLPNGQKFDLLTLALLGLPSLIDHFHRASTRLQELKFDQTDYMCLKYLLLVNPVVRGLSNMRLVQEAHEQAKQTLLEYVVNCYPHVMDKFSQLLLVLPDLNEIGSRGEDYLYFRHMNGNVPTQTLLMEMLHAKKK